MTNENWISCKKVGLPILKISYASMLMVIYKSKKVLVQTEYGEMFVAECEKPNMLIRDLNINLIGFHMELVVEK